MKASTAIVAAYAGLGLSDPVVPRGDIVSQFVPFIKILLKNFADEAPGVIEGVAKDNVIKVTRGETPEVGDIFAEVVKGFITRNAAGAIASEFEKPDAYIDGIPSNGGVIIPFIDKAICGSGTRNWFYKIICGSTTQPTHIGSPADGRGSKKVCANKAGYCVQHGLRTLCDDTKCSFEPGLPIVCFEAAKYCVHNGKRVDCGKKVCDFNRKKETPDDAATLAAVDKALKCRDISCWSAKDKNKSKVPTTFSKCAGSREECGKGEIPFAGTKVQDKMKYLAELESAIATCPEGSCWGLSTPFKEGAFIECGATKDDCKEYQLRDNDQLQRDLKKALESTK